MKKEFKRGNALVVSLVILSVLVVLSAAAYYYFFIFNNGSISQYSFSSNQSANTTENTGSESSVFDEQSLSKELDSLSTSLENAENLNTSDTQGL